MDGDGVAVGEAVSGGLFGSERLEVVVVHADDETTGCGLDGRDDAAFGGDDPAVVAGGEGGDAVADSVAAAAGRYELGPGELTGRFPSRPSGVVEGFDV